MTSTALLLLAVGAALGADSTTPAPAGRGGPLADVARVAAAPWHDTTAADTTRPRAVDVSGGYETRLRIHRWGGYAIIPLFAVQSVWGEQIFRQKRDVREGRRPEGIDGGLRTRHRWAAIGVGSVFIVNTVTGVWNLYDSRDVPEGRMLRTVHSALMLAADAGFVASGIMGADGRKHRNVAFGSMGVSALSALAMVVFDRE